jgi:hypothetical protein
MNGNIYINQMSKRTAHQHGTNLSCNCRLHSLKLLDILLACNAKAMVCNQMVLVCLKVVVRILQVLVGHSPRTIANVNYIMPRSCHTVVTTSRLNTMTRKCNFHA